MDVVYNERKLLEAIVYIASRLRDDRAGGATKLNKVLFFADFTHLRLHGRPITGADYQKLPNGPAPRRLMPLRRELVASGDAELVEELFLGYTQHRLVPTRAADLTAFSTAELDTIDSVIDDLAHLTGKQVSDLSHEEAAWRHTDDLGTIAYELAFVPKQQVVTPTARRLADDVAERYGIATAG